MAELFGTTVANINIHLKNIYQTEEFQQDSVIKEFLITASNGKKYKTNEKFRKEQDKNYISDFDQEVKKLLKK